MDNLFINPTKILELKDQVVMIKREFNEIKSLVDVPVSANTQNTLETIHRLQDSTDAVLKRVKTTVSDAMADFNGTMQSFVPWYERNKEEISDVAKAEKARAVLKLQSEDKKLKFRSVHHIFWHTHTRLLHQINDSLVLHVSKANVLEHVLVKLKLKQEKSKNKKYLKEWAENEFILDEETKGYLKQFHEIFPKHHIRFTAEALEVNDLYKSSEKLKAQLQDLEQQVQAKFTKHHDDLSPDTKSQ